jgi:hypothetical protein
MKYSPICLFVYNRLSETQKTIEALQANFLAAESDLFIFSDGWKNEVSRESVQCVRAFLTSIDGFKSVTIVERPENYGLAKSIITGATDILDKYGSVIVLEDDLVTSKNFLSYMNQSLEFYKENTKIWSISGFSFPIHYPKGYKFDTAFGVRASSWGWATWADRWQKVDWDVSDYEVFLKDKGAQKEFNVGGSDLCKMLNYQMSGKINSWAIRFCYAQFRNEALDVYPKKSKVQNVGFSEAATNTRGMGSRFHSELDVTENTNFCFSEQLEVDSVLLKQFQIPFSIYTRIKYKMLGLLK